MHDRETLRRRGAVLLRLLAYRHWGENDRLDLVDSGDNSGGYHIHRHIYPHPKKQTEVVGQFPPYVMDLGDGVCNRVYLHLPIPQNERKGAKQT